MFSLKHVKNLLLYYLGSGFQQWKDRPNGLYCFNYHRIGDISECELDSNVFSCNAAVLEKHLLFFRENFTVVSLTELSEIIKTKKPINKKLALLTFDDGYQDNYKVAYPLLKKYGLTATFFVATDFIGNSEIPWWDQIAWIIKQSKNTSIKIPFSSQIVNTKNRNINNAIRIALDCLKNSSVRIDIFIEKLAENANISQVLKHKDNLFMSWDMLKEMQKNTMDIGSHGCSHRILSFLTSSEQSDEIIRSKKILETQIGIKVSSFAFPVGNHASYTKETCELLKQAGYQLGFSYIAGINQNNYEKIMDLRRLSVANNCSTLDLKLSCANAKLY
ncbi:MAG: polysaccharide deacetylase family protein [Pseudomonadota bacterium]